MARTLSTSIREHILDAASALFYETGFHSIGVDALADRAGVSKMTLYRHFASKDDLIVAVLERFDNGAMTLYDDVMAAHTAPRERLLAVFRWIAERADHADCHGCAFQNGAAEFPEIASQAHSVALAHKRRTRDMYRREAAALSARDPDELADQLLLLTDGAWAAARMWGAGNPARSIEGAAAALIDAQVRRRR